MSGGMEMEYSGRGPKIKPHLPTRRRSLLPLLFILLLVLIYLLLLPAFVPVPEVTIDARGERVAGEPRVRLMATVISWHGDYILEAAARPRLVVAATRASLPLRISPMRVKPPLLSRYWIWKRTRTFEFTGEPILSDSVTAAQVTSATVHANFRFYIEREPPIVSDALYRVMPFNMQSRPIRVRKEVGFPGN